MKSLQLLILFGFVFAATSVALAQAQSQRDAEAEVIKTLIGQTTDAFNRHDAKAWARFCTPDAQLVTVRGESMNGVGEDREQFSADLRDQRPRGKTQDARYCCEVHPARRGVGTRDKRDERRHGSGRASASVTSGTERSSFGQGARFVAYHCLPQYDRAGAQSVKVAVRQPNHALQRTRHGVAVCNPRVPWGGR